MDPQEVTEPIAEHAASSTPATPEPIATARMDEEARILWLEFDARPDDETRALLKRNGWRWSGYRKQWHTNRKYAQVPYGIPYRDGGLCDYSSERPERLRERASKHRAASNEAYERSNRYVEHIPLGQPILVGHHSERGHRAALRKSHAAMDKSVAEARYADDLAQRAEASARHQGRKDTPELMQRRVDRLKADQRAMERRPWEGAHRAEWERRLGLMKVEIAQLEQAIADAGGIRADRLAAQGIIAEKGDLVQIHGFVGTIVRANPKTYTVKLKDDWTLKLGRDRLQRVIKKAAEIEAEKEA